MADITVTRTGKTLYHIDNELAHCLLEAFPEQFKRYERPPKPEPVPAWRIWANQYGEVQGLAITLGSEDIVVPGSPKGMVDRCQRALAGRKAPLPSDDLVELYAATAKSVTPIPRYDGGGR